jgi:tRNA pseudouridine32 synthase/23S rRNA pseudouridine746 synthase
MMRVAARRMVFRAAAVAGESRTACELLAEESGLSKLRIKDAMQKGAVWLARPGTPEKRLRRVRTVLRAGDVVALYYDGELLARVPPRAECRQDAGRFSVWFKPAGLMSQGTRFGDHCSLLREAEIFLRPRRAAFLVHRLDREASGLVVIAHDHAAAAAFSRIFAERRVVKRYRVEIRGRIGAESDSGRIDLPLDGKPAVTEYAVVSHDAAAGVSVVAVVLQTGRKHQIRRHFALAGFPVMGDPLYGEHNRNTTGLKLTATGLEFICPFTGQSLKFLLPGDPACSR